MFYFPVAPNGRKKTDWVQRIRAFKKIIKDHPYTATHYVYKNYPGALFQESDFREFREKHDNQ
jgi:hypothetical protein